MLALGQCPCCLAGLALETRQLDADTVGAGGNLPDSEELARLLPEFASFQLIGRGGMGAVFRAEQPKLDRVVAIKILPRRLAADVAFAERFSREAKALARLKHPNIVTAFDFGEADGLPFLVMEFVDGSDLASLVRESGPIPPEQAIDWICQAALGLESVHSHGVVHRDVKPGNLLVDEFGMVRLLDLGLARVFPRNDQQELAADLPITATGAVLGTIDFMAPEQAVETRSADARSDIYSLGCTLYFLLTGRPVYSGESAVKRILAHRDAPVPSLRAVGADVSSELDGLFQRMVSKDPDDRQQSMGEVIRDLRSLRQSPADRLTAASLAPDPGRKPASRQAGLIRKAKWLVAGTLLLATVAVLTGVMVLIETPTGRIRIESNDPAIRVIVMPDEYVIKGLDKSISLKPGERTLHVTRGDLTFETERFTVMDDEIVRLNVKFQSNVLLARDGSREIGRAAHELTGPPIRKPGPVEFRASGQTFGDGMNRSVALGDFDGDGDLDAVVGSGGLANGDLVGHVTVWLNDGRGRFESAEQQYREVDTKGVLAADFDGDGDLDVISAHFRGECWFLRNDGQARFDRSGSSLAPSRENWGCAAGDLDGDGDMDALIASENACVRLVLNRGDGRFETSDVMTESSHAHEIAIGDLDGDGDLDVFLADYRAADRVYLNDGKAGFIAAPVTIPSRQTMAAALGDLDGDGDLDVVTAGREFPNSVWLNDGSGSMAESGGEFKQGPAVDVALGDLDGDGDLDVFFTTRERRRANIYPDEVWLNDGRAGFTLSKQPFGASVSEAVALGDLDGDGDLDAFVVSDSGSIRVWLNQSLD